MNRQDVVQAIYDALVTMDPARLEPLRDLAVTPAEKDEAESLFVASLHAGADQRRRTLEVWEVLIRREYETPPSWEQLFDDLTPERQTRLAELYDALPDGARAEFDRRFGRPEL